MTQAATLKPYDDVQPSTKIPALAAGLFGYSIINGNLRACKPMVGYIRDIEQMPNFTPPATEVFVAHYISSHVGRTKSSS